MLTGRDLWVRHSRRQPWVLRGVEISVAPGEVVGLHGPSGVGKSTLGAVLAGFLRPEHGSVTVDGAPLIDRNHRGARPVQLIGQRPELMMDPRWRIDRIVSEGGAPLEGGAPPSIGDPTDTHHETFSPIGGLLQPDHPLDLGLIERAWLGRFPHELSGGELQRVNVARALRARPAYVIADEISVSLDAITQAQLWRTVLERAAGEGLGVLAISHDQHLLDAIADRQISWPPSFISQ